MLNLCYPLTFVVSTFPWIADEFLVIYGAFSLGLLTGTLDSALPN